MFLITTIGRAAGGTQVTDDIVYRLRVPLPYNLAGITTTQLGNERREAADEIERLRGEVLKYKALHEACKEHHGD
jgi:hypothetical protein